MMTDHPRLHFLPLFFDQYCVIGRYRDDVTDSGLDSGCDGITICLAWPKKGDPLTEEISPAFADVIDSDL